MVLWYQVDTIARCLRCDRHLLCHYQRTCSTRRVKLVVEHIDNTLDNILDKTPSRPEWQLTVRREKIELHQVRASIRQMKSTLNM